MLKKLINYIYQKAIFLWKKSVPYQGLETKEATLEGGNIYYLQQRKVRTRMPSKCKEYSHFSYSLPKSRLGRSCRGYRSFVVLIGGLVAYAVGFYICYIYYVQQRDAGFEPVGIGSEMTDNFTDILGNFYQVVAGNISIVANTGNVLQQDDFCVKPKMLLGTKFSDFYRNTGEFAGSYEFFIDQEKVHDVFSYVFSKIKLDGYPRASQEPLCIEDIKCADRSSFSEMNYWWVVNYLFDKLRSTTDVRIKCSVDYFTTFLGCFLIQYNCFGSTDVCSKYEYNCTGNGWPVVIGEQVVPLSSLVDVFIDECNGIGCNRINCV